MAKDREETDQMRMDRRVWFSTRKAVVLMLRAYIKINEISDVDTMRTTQCIFYLIVSPNGLSGTYIQVYMHRIKVCCAGEDKHEGF